MLNIDTTYQLIKKMMQIRDDLANWSRLSRENKLTEFHQINMVKKSHEIDEFLREIGTEWTVDYEENIEVRKIIENRNHQKIDNS